MFFELIVEYNLDSRKILSDAEIFAMCVELLSGKHILKQFHSTQVVRRIIVRRIGLAFVCRIFLHKIFT